MEFPADDPTLDQFPLTAMAIISYLLKYLRRDPSAQVGAPRTRTKSTGGGLSPTLDNSPDTAEARLFASLLISEIKLYNSNLVAQGVREGSLYHLLKKEIDRARSIYDSRIPLAIRSSHDHFQDELVRILADGNSDLLKM